MSEQTERIEVIEWRVDPYTKVPPEAWRLLRATSWWAEARERLVRAVVDHYHGVPDTDWVGAAYDALADRLCDGAIRAEWGWDGHGGLKLSVAPHRAEEVAEAVGEPSWAREIDEVRSSWTSDEVDARGATPIVESIIYDLGERLPEGDLLARVGEQLLAIDTSEVSEAMSRCQSDPESLDPDTDADAVAIQIPQTIADLEASIRSECISDLRDDHYDDIVILAMHDVYRRLRAEGTAV